MTDAQKERATVVAWLRACARDYGVSVTQDALPHVFHHALSVSNNMFQCAEEIERGEHVK